MVAKLVALGVDYDDWRADNVMLAPQAPEENGMYSMRLLDFELATWSDDHLGLSARLGVKSLLGSFITRAREHAETQAILAAVEAQAQADAEAASQAETGGRRCDVSESESAEE